MDLQGYCKQLGWDAAELSRQAGINPKTARRAMFGEVISSRVAREIAKALSAALGRTINVGDIDGLKVG
jgi:hypothetical protein